ncbi:phosphotransferase [Enterococcus ureasiticus]|uniref:Aminoglycoside phosphotransferase domain-containing protein n=1 Tax=Enterococcus ureasiticus TaxID=903984 RepID=A0A1E5GCB6_9ENTE|nr:phosphotransferase [Enterococcus ureasiticus]OEG10352.1 hypothetical protein BCR21_13470 [Enterococcus ureasiticus]
MSNMAKVNEQVADALHIDSGVIEVSPHKSGVWGNILFEIEAPKCHLLYKEFLPFTAVEIAYNPPNITPEKRLKTSVSMQNFARNNVHVIGVEIPKVIVEFPRSFLMDYIEEGLDLKYFLDNGLKIYNPKALGEAIAEFHNSSVPKNDVIETNELLLYKIGIQYCTDLIDGLTDQHRKIYKQLYSELLNFDDSFVPIHGDFNGKNILIDQSGMLGIIDFEHSGMGKCVYDLSYFVAEVVIAAIIRPEKISYRQYIEKFLVAYVKKSKQLESELDSLWSHVAVQMLYRLTGPSAYAWTKYFSTENLDKINRIGVRMIGCNFVLSDISNELKILIEEL